MNYQYFGRFFLRNLLTEREYPSSVSLRVLLLIKSFRSSLVQFIQRSIAKILILLKQK